MPARARFSGVPRPARITAALSATFVILLTTIGCQGQREIRTAEVPAMHFASPLPPIAGRVEVCVRPELHGRQWNVKDHPYRIELGKRAAVNFERMAKAAFQRASARYTNDCGAETDTPWIEAEIVSANRDWDGIEGVFDPEPVDTALTMAFALYADDGSPLWSREVVARSRVVDPPPPPFLYSVRALRGARDFGVVLSDALDQGYRALIESPDVRAAFGDTSLLERAAAAKAISTDAETQDEAAPGSEAGTTSDPVATGSDSN